MEKHSFDARLLRNEGKIAGERPFVPLEQNPIEILGPNIETAPKGPVDVVIILGMGPVEPVLGGSNREPRIGKPRMRNNTVAGLELVANGYVRDAGIIIPTGTATADPRMVEESVQVRQALTTDGEELGRSSSQMKDMSGDKVRSVLMSPSIEEADTIYTTSEAELMERLFNRAHAKSGTTGKDLPVEVFPDHQATETADNFIYALNELDRRSLAENGELFKGSISVITSRFHIARAMETARYLGLEGQMVPLVSQEVLSKMGYRTDRLLGEAGEKFDYNTRWNEQKWIRTLHQMPAYFLPVLTQIENNSRFIATLKHLQKIYGNDTFESFGLTDINLENATELRVKLSGIKRTNPTEEEWLKSDVDEVNEAINNYSQFTSDWLDANRIAA